MASIVSKIPLCERGGDSLISSKYANRIIRAVNGVRSVTINPIVNVAQVQATEDGWIIDLAQCDSRLTNLEQNGGGGSSNASNNNRPFDPVLPNNNTNTLSFTINPGTINGLIPNNWANTFSIANNVVGYEILSVSVANNKIASAAISIANAAPVGIPVTKGAPPTAFDYLLGVISNGVWYRVIGNSSLTAIGQDEFHVSQTSPAPGTLPYDIYYSWLISANA